MKIKIQLVIEEGDKTTIEAISYLERKGLSAETLGLTLKEAKTITSEIQKRMVPHQITEFIAGSRFCSCCGTKHLVKGYHSLVYRTLFGKVFLKSQRLLACKCQDQQQSSFSPLVQVLKEHISPELSYLESKWASLMSYGMTVKLLEEVFPLETQPSSVCYTIQKISTRLETELAEEKHVFIEGCQREWDKLPRPDVPIMLSLDGGYIHAREGKNRKAGWFEAIVGKSVQEGRESKRFGYVTNYETHPKRKLYEMLQNQGLQMNQDITFLTDGGDTVRDLPLYLSPRSEHILDWFHVTMRITVLKQMSKGAMGKDSPDFEKKMERLKWFLWHGNVFQVREILESLIFDLDEFYENKEHKKYKLLNTLNEFDKYIELNGHFIPNYGERYRNGESISSSIAESTVNGVCSGKGRKDTLRIFSISFDDICHSIFTDAKISSDPTIAFSGFYGLQHFWSESV